MPNVAIWVPETSESITRPVAMGILRDLTQMLGMDPAIRTVYPGSAEVIAQPGSTLSQNPSGNNFWPADEKMFAEVTETSQTNRALSTSVFRADNVHCFADPRVDTYIKPVYSATEMVIAIRYRAPNKVTAERWRNDIRVRYSRGRVESVHTITYHYGIPYAFLAILQEIGRLKELQAPYGETMTQWVTQCASTKATNITDLAGNNAQLVIAETQTLALGWFDFEFEPEAAQKDGEGGAYVVSFEYHVAYDKVLECAMHYPLMVHNNLIGQRFRDKNVPYVLSSQKAEASLNRTLMSDLVPGMYQPVMPSLNWLRLPSYDDWMPTFTPEVTSTAMSMMIQVDPDDPNLVINMRELGDYVIDHDVEHFLGGEAPWIGLYRQSVFFFTLYEENTALPGNNLTMDNLFSIHSNAPMDLRERYHLRWAVLTDLTMLSPAAQMRLRTQGAAALKILDAIRGFVRVQVDLPPLINGQISQTDFLAFANTINQRRRNEVGIPTNTQLALTVGCFIIDAQSMPPATTRA